MEANATRSPSLRINKRISRMIETTVNRIADPVRLSAYFQRCEKFGEVYRIPKRIEQQRKAADTN